MQKVHDFLLEKGWENLKLPTSQDDVLEYWVDWITKTVIAIAPGYDIQVINGFLGTDFETKLDKLLAEAFEPQVYTD